MLLELKTETVQMVSDASLIAFITQAYDLQNRYELTAIEEMSNGDYKLFNVKPEPLTAYEQQQITRLKQTGYCEFVTDVLLKDLCNRQWISPGKYLVHAFW